jgi:hypothetical protein
MRAACSRWLSPFRCSGCGFAVSPSWYCELFAARPHYNGASLGFQVGAMIGGLTRFEAATFMARTGGATWPISVYLIVRPPRSPPKQPATR